MTGASELALVISHLLSQTIISVFEILMFDQKLDQRSKSTFRVTVVFLDSIQRDFGHFQLMSLGSNLLGLFTIFEFQLSDSVLCNIKFGLSPD